MDTLYEIYKLLDSMLKKFFDILMKILIVGTIGLTLLALVKPELIKQFIDWIKDIVYTLWYWNYLIIFLSSLVEGLPVLWVAIPGQNILLIVGWFFAELSKNNLYFVIIIASVWAILSNYLWYILWVHHWDVFFKKYGLWFGIWETEAKYLKKWIQKWWPWWIILGKFHGVARAFIPFIAGSMGMHRRTFIIYNVIGSIIRATTIVILGVIFAEYYETLIDYAWYIMTLILVVTWIYIYKFKRKEFLKYIEEKNKELEEKIK